MNALIKRNLQLYFRDRMAVFFSLLAVFISLGIYFLFLAENVKAGLASQGVPELDFLMDSWFLAGTLGVVSVTTTLGSYGTMIDDEIFMIKKDFMASPMKRSRFALSYIIASCIIGILMSLIVLISGEIFILVRGGDLLSVSAVLHVLGLVFISVGSGSALMYVLSLFLHTSSSFSGASTVIGVLIGFLTGLYMPIGELPEAAQNVMKFIPAAHSSSLFRSVIMQDSMNISFAQAPASAMVEFKQHFGMVLRFGDMEVTAFMSICFLIGTAAFFFLFSLLLTSRKKTS